MIKITGGKLRGRTMKVPNDLKLRPMAGKMREAVFNHLGSFDGLEVLDAFAGAGTLGIEALSRGAKSLNVLEIEPKHLNLIADNLKNFRLEGKATLQKRNAFRASGYFVKNEKTFDIIFLDPPYSFLEKDLNTTDKLIASWQTCLKPGGQLILGHPSKIFVKPGHSLYVSYKGAFGNRGVSVLKFCQENRENESVQ